ncbi:MerR family transcriptional regulator [Amycolatopsis sp. lyj-112]|uniref:MerR family transcriptional regulator n=1 Tax=Amycolatopsis sp. lyj-112 TaxID=2789288 RepID=UPI00397A21B3
MSDDEWLLIAEFARRCRLPASTLRYYDRVGLLTPAAVDPVTGYRRYLGSQLPTAVTIARLRAAGTAPEVIARVLRGGRSAEAALDGERRRLTGEIAERARSLAVLDDLAPFEPGVPRSVILPAARVPALAFDTDFGALTGTIIRTMATLRAGLRRQRSLTPDVEWGALLPLDLGDRVTGHVFARTDAAGLPALDLPCGPALEITHRGDLDRLAHTYDRVLAEAPRPTGFVIEDYFDGPRVRVRVPVAE